MFRNRLITSIILIPIVIGAVILGGWWLFAILGLGFIFCGYEFFTLAQNAGYRPDRWLGVALIALLLVDSLLEWHLTTLWIAIAAVVPPLWEFRRHDHEGALASWALTVLGVVYIGILGSQLFTLRALPDGKALLGVTLFTTWAADTAAYSIGTAFGHRPFFPEISPKKTWEGTIGGVVGAAITFGLLMSIYGQNPLLAVAGGIGIAIAASAGDLVESLVKRQLGAKDSGSILRGHGGFFDRLDSTLFTVAFAYCFFLLTGY